jgi:glucose-6-phosphate 1-epimerase
MQVAHPPRFRHRTCTFHGQQACQLTAPDGSEAMVLLQGAQVVSWKTSGGVERLYLSEQAHFAAGAAVRGGVPVVFPQFANQGALVKHGFARTQPWALHSVDTTETDALLILRLASNDSTRALWPFDFELELSLRFSCQRLDMELAVTNTGDKPLSFTAALHTYLLVPDIEAVRLEGLSRLRFRDAVANTVQVDHTDSVRVNGELDRVYFDAARTLTMHSGGAATERVEVSQTGFKDVVVWNPGPVNSATLKDMPDDGWRHMLCVEAALVNEPVRLAAGDDWWGRQSIDCSTAE